MIYKKSLGNDRPETVDCTSSPSCVYLRKNIVKVERTDDVTGKAITEYEYDEACISKDEYIAMLTYNQKDIEDAIVELASIIGGE